MRKEKKKQRGKEAVQRLKKRTKNIGIKRETQLNNKKDKKK